MIGLPGAKPHRGARHIAQHASAGYPVPPQSPGAAHALCASAKVSFGALSRPSHVICLPPVTAGALGRRVVLGRACLWLPLSPDLRTGATIRRACGAGEAGLRLV